jgi:endonuclease/exonuclease/phosphatase family metal-dependent hydrolase
MRLPLAAVLAALFPTAALAQTGVEVTPRGADATLDVGSWNVEFFGFDGRPPNDAIQVDRVEAVVARGEIDLWGLQEIVDAGDFEALLDSLADDGYAGVLGPSVSSSEEFDQKLAFVYDTSVIAPLADATTLFPDSTFIFAGRLPLELRARVTLGDQATDVRFITFHAKASSDPDSYRRRQRAATLLKAYTDALIAAGEAVVILGDFNDLLTGATRGSTFASPYAAFVADDDYTAATLATEEAGLPTFCGSDDDCDDFSTIDHVLLSADFLTFVPDADNPQLQRYGELLPTTPGGGIVQYTATTSDHLPVVANVRLEGGVAAGPDPEAGPVALLAPAPSPFREATALRFRLDAPGPVRLDVFDTLGRRVVSVEGTYGAGEHAVRLGGRGLAGGLYVVRLEAAGEVRARTVLRVR